MLRKASSFKKAINAWQRFLSKNQIILDPQKLSLAQTATFASSKNVLAILQPKTVKEVQNCIKVANEFKIPLYPVSTGLNWGYGSQAPTSDAVLLQLNRMKKIIEFNEDLAYITVEPGVTFAQIFDFCRKHQSQLYLNVTGSSPHTSVIGNALERGLSIGQRGDHYNHCCSLEVVLGSGEVVHTSFDRYTNAKNAAVALYPNGPGLNSFFMQSNFGVVTKITFWLNKIPAYIQLVILKIDHYHQLEKLINTLRELIKDGIIEPIFSLFNDYRTVAASLGQYPWQEADDQTPLADSLLKKYKSRYGVGAWNTTIKITAFSKEDAQAKQKTISQRLLKLVGSLDFYIVSKAEIMRASRVYEKNYHKKQQKLPEVLSFIGLSSEDNVKLCYWRKKSVMPKKINPDRDKCGVIWIAPVVPMQGNEVARVIKYLTNTILKYGFEPMINLICVNEHANHVVSAIIYDRSIPGEDEKAYVCYRLIAKKLNSFGYYSYRLPIIGMPLPQSDDAYTNLIAKFKIACDPKGIISPGRYT